MRSEEEIRNVRDFLGTSLDDMDEIQMTQTDEEIVDVLNWVLEEEVDEE